MNKTEFIQLKSYRFYPSQNRLNRLGRDIRLEPKVSELLVLFLNSNGRTISKEELFDSLWKGQIVTDDSLKRVISKLRNVLLDSAEKPEFIETITGKGYRFKYADKKPSKQILLIAGALVLIIILMSLFLVKTDTKFHLEYEMLTFDSYAEARPFPSADDSAVVFISNNQLFDFYNIDLLNLYNSQKKRLVSDSSLKFLVAFSPQNKNQIIDFAFTEQFIGFRLTDLISTQQSELIELLPSKLVDIDFNYLGTHMYYTAAIKNGTAVFKYSLTDKDVELVTNPNNQHDFRCRISEDEQFLAVLRMNDEFKKTELILIDIQKNKELKLQTDFEPKDLDWNPFDKYLYVIGKKNNISYLYKMRPDFSFVHLSEIDPDIASFRSFNNRVEFVSELWYSKRSVQSIQIANKSLEELDPVNRSNFQPVISASGEILAYKTDRDQRTNLVVKHSRLNQTSFSEIEPLSSIKCLGNRIVVTSNNSSSIYEMKNNQLSKSAELPFNQLIYVDSINTYYAVKKTHENDQLIELTALFEQSTVLESFQNEIILYTTGSNLFYLMNGRLNQVMTNNKVKFIRQMPSSRSTDLAFSKSGYYWIEHSNQTQIKYHSFVSKMDQLIYDFGEIVDIRYLSVDKLDQKLIYQKTDNSNSNLVKIKLLED